MRDEVEAPKAALLLATVAAVADELHPGRTGGAAALDSRLDYDLGFDSLGRVELLARLERTFGVGLPDRLAIEAETPRDLLRAVEAAPRAGAQPSRERLEAPGTAALELPAAAQTLLEVLEWHGRRRPEAVHVHFYQDEGAGAALTYRDLLHQAGRIAAGLLRQAVAPGDRVALMLPTGPDYFATFMAILWVGAVPVPLYPPFRASQIEEHLRRQAGILSNCQAGVLVTTAELRGAAELLLAQVAALRRVALPQELAAEPAPSPPRRPGSDIALLQYTSGSTGAPKGVILTHANLLANVRAMGRAVAVAPGDVVASWLPLYHDMGLIGAWLGSLYHGLPLVLMPPLAFVARPARWLWAIHRYRATLTAAPNFAFELCLRRVTDDQLAGLDLSSLRGVYNGAEAISPATMERFIERFARHGFRRTAMMPVYGLAESAVGLAFPPLGRGPLIDTVKRRRLTVAGEAVPAAAGEADLMRLVCCGRPLPGHEIRIVDDHDRELPERRQGRIQFRGPSATSGYFRNAEATRTLFHGDWLDTGDLGYVADGEIYVTGRIKDIVIKAGRNIYPEEIEDAVGNVEGIRKGNVAVFGAAAGDAGERLVVVAETRKTDPRQRRELEAAVAAAVIDIVGMPPDEVVLAPPNSVLKTSSGKIRRAACRKLYEDGALGHARRPVWRQILSLRLAAVAIAAARWRARLGELAFAARAWAAVAAVVLVGWPGVVLLPGRDRRWRLLRTLLRVLPRLTGTRLAVSGADGLPPQPAVVIANHASYLDGFVLAAALPRRLCFVAKAELARSWTTALPLGRLGTAFVERLDRMRSLADAKALPALAAAGAPLVFFPEGTFTRMPGLLPFHMGAFVLAASAGLPLVPVAIRGTRSTLRAGSWRPRPGTISVAVGPPIAPRAVAPDELWPEACRLRDACRQWILDHCGEPDLAYEKPPI